MKFKLCLGIRFWFGRGLGAGVGAVMGGIEIEGRRRQFGREGNLKFVVGWHKF